jgi:redox-sensitive bicupin YhaK (pirin superfamily)
MKFKIVEKGTRFILLAGLPLNEPIAWQGPFVLNENSEIKKAF